MVKFIKVSEGEAIVDDKYYDAINKFHWCIVRRQHTNYAVSSYKSRTIAMHRFVMSLFCGVEIDMLSSESPVDHIDHNGLNNQISNLRLVTQSENCQNRIFPKQSNNYIGVSGCKAGYIAQIGVNGHKIYLGTFDDEIDAAERRDLASIKIYKATARLNFPEKIDKYVDILLAGFDPMPERKFIPYSKQSGVTYRKDLDKWQAYISISKQKELDIISNNDYRRIVVGTFPTEQEAIDAHQKALADIQDGKKIVTPARQNISSPYMGVFLNPSGKYLAKLVLNGKKYSLNTYETQEEAAEIYDLALVKLNGNLIKLNFPNRLKEYREKISNGFNPIPEKNKKTSKYHGVSYRNDKKKWESYVYDLETKERKRLGYFKTEHDAAIAREPIEKETNKERAKLNFA